MQGYHLTMELSAGTRLGPYEIQRRIGAGGMGVVYGALDSRLGRSVAIESLSYDGSTIAYSFPRETADLYVIEPPTAATQ